MKHRILLLFLLFGIAVQAQIKIGDNPQNIDPSSVLELESTSRVLVITRVNTAQMNAIIPSVGALVYNTDVQCLHYYTGAAWTNVCDAVAGSLSITAENGTIVVTPNNNTYEIKVGQIKGENIVDATIFGQDLANGSITQPKLALNSVGAAQLRENSVGAMQLMENSVGTLEVIDGTIQAVDIQPGGFNQLLTTSGTGEVLWVNKEELGATIADQVTISGKGIAADPIRVADVVLQRITSNTNALNTKENLSNKSPDVSLGNSDLLYPSQRAVKIYVDNQIGDLGGAVNDNQRLSLSAQNILALERGGNVNLTPYVNTDNQTLSRSGNEISISGGNTIDLGGLGGGGGGGGPDRAIIGVALNNSNLVFTGENGAFTGNVDLSTLIGNGADGVISSVALNGTDLEFTGNGGGFGGTVDLSQLSGGGDTPVEVDGLTISGSGIGGDPLKIIPSNVFGQFLRTDPITGGVIWDNMPEGTGGGTTVKADGITLTGTGSDTNPLKIISSTTLGQFLRTDPTSGAVVWADLPDVSGGIPILVDNSTITGDGESAQLQVMVGGITSTEILDETILNEDIGNATIELTKIRPLATNPTTNQMLINSTDGEIRWAAVSAGGANQDLAGVLATGTSAGNNPIKDLPNPTDPQDAATMAYVDAQVGSGGSSDGVVSNVEINGTNLDFTGSGGGFNGSINLSGLSGGGEIPDNELITNAELIGTDLIITDPGQIWTIPLASLAGGGGSTELADQITIIGDGTEDNKFSVGDGAITTSHISNGAILAEDLNNMGALDGQILKWDITANAGLGGWILADDRTDGTGLPNLSNGTFLIGDALNDPQERTINGDATIDNAGVLTIQDDAVTATMINANVAGAGITKNPVTGALEVDTNTLTGSGDISSTDITVTGGTNAAFADVTLEIADDAVTAAMINANVAGAGITKNPGTGALEVDTSTLTGSGDISSTDITVTGGTNAAFADVTLEIADDAVTAAMINANVAGAGITKNPGTGALEVDTSTLTGSGDISSTDITVTGGANAAFANVTLEIADDAVTAAMINANVAGAGITKNPGTGALEVDTSTLTGSGDISSTDITVTGGTNAAFADVTLEIADDAVTAAMINANVAGAGITKNPGTGALEVDTSTLTGSGDISSTDITVTGGANAAF
ncbi:beta strand repeat-containing protein, partial [Arenibacter antarcticus]